MHRYALSFVLFFSLLLCNAQKTVFYEGLAAFKEIKNSKTLFGFKNEKGKIVIPARYDSVVDPFHFGRAIVVMNKQYGTIDQKGKTIIPFQYSSIVREQFGLTPVKSKEHVWGFYSYSGAFVIPCTYDNFRLSNKGKHIIAQKAGKWGIVNQKNVTLISFDYKNIEFVSGKQYRLTRFNKWERMNAAGTTLGSYEYDSVRFNTMNLLSYNNNGWKGILKKDGSLTLKNSFEEIGVIQYDLVAVKQNGLWGVRKMNSDLWILPAAFDIIRMDSLMIYAGMSLSTSGITLWKLYNVSGTLLNTETFSAYKPLSNGLMAVQSITGKWGFVNETGKNIIARFYTAVGNFNNGLCYVELNGEKHILNKNGDVVLSGQDVYLYNIGLLKLDAFQNKQYMYHPVVYTELIPLDTTFIKIKQNDKYGLINTNGKEILAPIYSDIKAGNSRTTFSVVLNNRIKVIQLGLGTFNADKNIKSIDAFYNEYAVFLYGNGEFGYVDNQARIRIAPQYSKALPFENEIAAVRLNGKWGLINKNEVLIAQPYYEKVSPFINNVSIVKEKGIYYLLGINGKILTPEGYDYIEATPKGNYLLVKNNLYGIANKNGKEIISPRYQIIEEFSSTLFKAKVNDLFGVIDVNQKIILHFKYQEILFDLSSGEFLSCEEGERSVVKVE